MELSTVSRDPQSHLERGAALLVVLSTLALALSTAMTLAGLAAEARKCRILDGREATVADIVDHAEDIALEWLETSADEVVLAPDVDTPSVDVLDDKIPIGRAVLELRIRAYDQEGMVPARMARGGSPLRACLSDRVRSSLDALQGAGGAELDGLDRLCSVDVFPPIASKDVAVVGADEPALGAVVATHGRDRIHVNTAPMGLVIEALRAIGQVGSLEPILAARSAGRRSTALVVAPRRRETPAVSLTSSSDAWAFRVDAHLDGVRRSSWLVFEREQRSGAAGSFRKVQRLVIGD